MYYIESIMEQHQQRFIFDLQIITEITIYFHLFKKKRANEKGANGLLHV